MSPESGSRSGLSFPWGEFLQELDELLPRPVELHCLGGFVLMALYARPIPTADIDYISALPSEEVHTLEALAGRDSKLAKKYKVYLQFVPSGLAEVPENYAERLLEIFPQRFSKLRLRALEPHDIALSKLTRSSPIDERDVQFLAEKGLLDAAVLEERYRRELRPNLANQERHDLTLRLWLEAYFRQ